MFYHFGEEGECRVITDYEAAVVKETTEAINRVCNYLGISVKDFAKILYNKSDCNDAYNAYPDLVRAGCEKTPAFIFENVFIRMDTLHPTDDHFGGFVDPLVEMKPYLNKITKRITGKELKWEED